MKINKIEKPLFKINLKRETFPGEKQDCQICGKEALQQYWKYGEITIVKRSIHCCDFCHQKFIEGNVKKKEYKMKKSEILIALGLSFIVLGYYIWVTTEQRKSSIRYELSNFKTFSN
jgi:hypothetical protein